MLGIGLDGKRNIIFVLGIGPNVVDLLLCDLTQDLISTIILIFDVLCIILNA